MNVDQKLRLMNNSPALLEAVALLLPLARKEAETLSAAAKYAKGFSTTQAAADKWSGAVLVAEKAILASTPYMLAQTYRP
jgi:hypothetical protein